MSIKIDHRIIDYTVLKPQDNSEPLAGDGGDKTAATAMPTTKANGDDRTQLAERVRMHEKAARPRRLVGGTYKIKTPISEHAFYVTINDVLINPSTPYEKRRPFEIFINSKNMDHYQWISGLTLIISAVFRKGGDVAFLVKELQSVFDPKGGYFKSGGKFMPSLVAEIGEVIESHLKMIGMLTKTGLDSYQQAFVAEKRSEFQKKQLELNGLDPITVNADTEEEPFPAGALLCAKCYVKASVLLDGCMTCLSCGDSKCS